MQILNWKKKGLVRLWDSKESTGTFKDLNDEI